MKTVRSGREMIYKCIYERCTLNPCNGTRFVARQAIVTVLQWSVGKVRVHEREYKPGESSFQTFSTEMAEELIVISDGTSLFP